jgi:PAS domain S-box-containing protein
MKKKINKIFAFPAINDAEKNRIAKIIHILVIGMVCVLLIGILHNSLYGKYASTVILVSEVIIGVVIYHLNYRGRIQKSAMLLVISLIIMNTLLMIFSGDGTHDIALLVYPAIIVAGSLLLKRKYLIQSVILCLASIILVFTLEYNEIIITKYSKFVSLNDLIDGIGIIILTSLITGLLVSDFRKNINKLTISEKRFKMLAESAFEGIFITENGIITDVNNQSCQMFGYSENEFFNIVFDDLFPENERPVLEKLIKKSEKNQENLSEYQARKKNGIIFPVEIHHRLVDMDDKRIEIINIRDITEKRKLEKQIIQSEKLSAIGELAGGIAHDLNNILTSLVGNTDLLNRKICHDCKTTNSKYLEALIKSNQRAKNIILQILTFSKRQAVNQETFNLNDVVLEIDKLLTRLIPENICIHKNIIDMDLNIEADISQVEQIIVNIIINARDAIKNNGMISISTKDINIDSEIVTRNGVMKPGKYALLKIIDNGCGIKPEIIDRVFDPFFTTKEIGKGTGLGLSIVLNNISKNNGYINLYSDLEKGTEFNVFFPLIAVMSKNETEIKVIDIPTGKGEKIMVVEDDESIRQYLAESLMDLHYRVYIAGNGVEALQIIENDMMDVILTDITMPEMGGVELLKNLREKNVLVPVIAMSGFYQYEGIRNLEFYEILDKPLEIQKIALLLQKIKNDRLLNGIGKNPAGINKPVFA